MNPILKNIFAVLLGLFLGGQLNGLIISQGAHLFPMADGVNPNDLESIKAYIHSYEPKHFIAPFLAHALGTFVAALVCSLIAASRHKNLVLAIGILFLLGGIGAVVMIGGPLWFIVVDLALAYLPMAFLGLYVARKLKPSSNQV